MPLAFPTGQSFLVSRRALLESITPAAILGAGIVAGFPSPSSAGSRRIKGGGPIVTLDSGAQYQDMSIGDGAKPKKGDRVAVHYSLFYKGTLSATVGDGPIHDNVSACEA